jgi:outer membrane immunogenic protein
MKRLCLGLALGTSVVVSAGGALADGMNRASIKDAPSCSRNFQGFYVGVNGGYADYKVSQNDHDGYFIDNAGWTASERGFTGGAQVGYNWQRSCNTLFGIEADWSWADLDATTTQGIGAVVFNFSMTSSIKSYGTVRTRTGLVFDNLLLYVTGGLAIADIDFNTLSVIPGLGTEGFSFGEIRWGWTVGVGGEWALWNNVSFKSEVLYMDFGDQDHSFISPQRGGGRFSFSTQDSLWVSRAGLNFRF